MLDVLLVGGDDILAVEEDDVLAVQTYVAPVLPDEPSDGETAIDLAIGDGNNLAVDANNDLAVSLFTPLGDFGQSGVPQFSPEDYQAAFQALMPRGRVWPNDPGSVQSMVALGLSTTFARSNAAAAGLIVDAFPATAVNLLPEWEETLGLPDPCAGPSPTLQVRQAHVVAKFISTGGQSVSYFIALAASLGYPITITEFTGDQAHHWQVNAPTVSEFYFRAGGASAGEPLIIGGNAVLECVFNELKPAHTTVSFQYG
jgi:uncharacterized protein YmfQ (DUF2313 family)